MSDRTHRTPKKDWAEPFLAEFANMGNVKLACEAAGIGRTTAYERRKNDEAFATDWNEAEEQSHDRLEQEAFRRAHDGVDDFKLGPGGQLVEMRRYSDTLLIFLLKARRPERFRDNARVEHTGPGGGPIAVEGRQTSLGEILDVLKAAGADGG